MDFDEEFEGAIDVAKQFEENNDNNIIEDEIILKYQSGIYSYDVALNHLIHEMNYTIHDASWILDMETLNNMEDINKLY